MNEYLFTDAAKLKADRSRAGQAAALGAPAQALEAGPVTRQLLAFAAALLVNAAVLGTLQWSAYTARPVPNGQVVITQLDADTPRLQLARN